MIVVADADRAEEHSILRISCGEGGDAPPQEHEQAEFLLVFDANK